MSGQKEKGLPEGAATEAGQKKTFWVSPNEWILLF
jgi:sarcosine oxidase gamma subunit